MLPSASAIVATKASTAVAARTSSSAVAHRRPSASTVAAVAFMPSTFRSQMATSAPKAARPSAMAAPSPCAAPVTTATFPVRSTARGEIVIAKAYQVDFDVNMYCGEMQTAASTAVERFEAHQAVTSLIYAYSRLVDRGD